MAIDTHEQVSQLMATFNRQLLTRQMRAAQLSFVELRPILTKIEPDCVLAGTALRRLAEATDLGWLSILQLGQAVHRCKPVIERSTDARAIVDATLASAVYNHLRGWHDRAIEDLTAVERLIAAIPSLIGPGLGPSLKFHWGRCHAGKGQYDAAITSLTEAIALAQKDGLTAVTGVIRIALATVYLERGRLDKTDEALRAAQRLVAETPDDVMARVAIHAVRAKLTRRQGLLPLALEAWERAAGEFNQRTSPMPVTPPQHLMGKIQIGMALTRVRMLVAARTKMGRARAKKQFAHIPVLEDRCTALRVGVLGSLDQARAIYSAPQNEHGLSSVHWVDGLLAVAEDRWEDAWEKARAAHGTALSGDHVARARAKQLESQADLIAADQAEAAERCRFRNDAVTHAREAMASASRTQHARLQARSKVYLAAALLIDGDEQELAEARQLIDEAKKIIPPAIDDYLWSKLNELDVALPRPTGIEPWVVAQVHRATSGETTMEKIAEDFKAEFVLAMMTITGQTFQDVIRLLRIGGALRFKLRARLDVRHRARSRQRPRPSPE